MSARDWKPGDVALVDGRIALVWREEAGDSRPSFVYTDSDGDWCSVWADSNNGRPLVVIDPEDREQVERLHAAYLSANGATDVADMQAALRSLLAPPRPAEPTGWGAVAEDDTGAYWTLYAPESGAWINYAEGKRHWHAIAAVRVLSEGVTQ